MENNDILEYKNFFLFYKTLYTRLFDLINLLIDEREYNIIKLQNNLIDFLDSYSYYLFKQKLITEDDEIKTHEEILKELKDFSNFYEPINNYPSENYYKIRRELIENDYDMSKLGVEKQTLLIKEYYSFYGDTLRLLKVFVDVTSKCGFLPIVKNMASSKSIGYANFDLFFTKLEELKIKASLITSEVNLYNSLISRRVMYCILVVFSPYFKNKKLYEQLEKEINFDYLNIDDKLKQLRNIYKYGSIDNMPIDFIKETNKTLLIPLKTNISIIKRFISYEFGERDMSPTIKKKYSYDPTGV